MEVILLQKLTQLGELGSLVQVKPGYARNYLIPQGKALPATRRNRNLFEQQRAEFEKAQRTQADLAEQRIEWLRNLGALSLKSKAGAEGKLFGAVTVNDVVAALVEKGFQVRKQEIRLPEKYLKQAGQYPLTFHPMEGKEAGLHCELELIIQGESTGALLQ